MVKLAVPAAEQAWGKYHCRTCGFSRPLRIYMAGNERNDDII
jgi:hypothetical protein